MQNTLDKVLGKFAKLGFSLREVSDGLLELLYKDKGIANFTQSFTQSEIMEEAIRKECKEYLTLLEEYKLVMEQEEYGDI